MSHTNDLQTPTNRLSRNNPPRLQHSPSLPNIWFPPHLGPIPAQISDAVKGGLCRSSTPPLKSERLRNSASTSSAHRSTSSLNHPMTRTLAEIKQHHSPSEKDQASVLLTPPLTPSASIRTTASAELSATEEDRGAVLPNANLQEAMRFLLLGNISPDAAAVEIKQAIIEAFRLYAATSPSALHSFSVVGRGKDGATSDVCIKYMNDNRQKSHGLVILAFHDVRHACFARECLSAPSTISLSQCLDKTISPDGQQRELTCRFVAPEELVEMVGDSPYISGTDGRFVIKMEQNSGDAVSVSDILSGLKHILEEHGELLSVSIVNDESTAMGPLTFLVEYFDDRDADEAYLALSDRKISGVSATLSGRSHIQRRQPSGHNRLRKPKDGKRTCPTRDHTSTIGAAGQRSRIRERFNCATDAERCVIDGPDSNYTFPQTTLQTTQPHGAPSPTYFYTSPMTSVYGHGVRSPTVEGGLSMDRVHDFRNLEYGSEDARFNGGASHADCFYCPSRGPSSSDSAGYGMSFAPLSSTGIFYPQLPLPPINTMFGGLASPISPSVPSPFPYLSHSMTPTSSTPEIPQFWGMEPVGAAFHGPSLAGEFWNQEGHAVPEGPNGFVHPQSVNPHMAKPGGSQDFILHPSLRNGGPITTGRSTHARPALRHSTASPPREVAEHNRFNIAKIEDGQEMRTTVMIKNIPNKMSDQELVAYIGKVCPRKIDFLYLRMDFQNGCNFGYAFVNFISIQDLLVFAKRKLGERWNMFSSEKVLQMSYAAVQGKEAQIEKFRNSSVMDEQEAWRPKIFYSEPGENQGLPEPFPAPTHLRRKERSSHNRESLYVPGVQASLPGAARRQRRLQDNHIGRHPESSSS